MRTDLCSWQLVPKEGPAVEGSTQVCFLVLGGMEWRLYGELNALWDREPMRFMGTDVARTWGDEVWF